mgnify:CR=1 FL=1
MADYNYNGAWRWAYGHIDPDDLDGDYDLLSFPRAADQPDIMDWVEPGDGGDLYQDAALVVEAMDASLGGQGGGRVVWPLILTPLMVDWIGVNRFDGRKKSAPATIMTFDATKGWVKLHCTAQWPKDITSLRREGNVFNPFPITFTDTREAV